MYTNLQTNTDGTNGVQRKVGIVSEVGITYHTKMYL